jgi:hypothetical protein
MTKKSQSRINRDIKNGLRAPQSRSVNVAPANARAPLQATAGGGFKMSPADRILSECAQGLGLVPNKQKNTCWDDLLGVYRECAAALFQHTMVTEVMRDRELMTFIEDLDTFNANVRQFAADLGQMNKELQDLYTLHHGKSGGSEDPQVVLHSFGLFEQYKLWMTKHDGVVKPTVMHILEQTNKAELLRANARSQLGLLNADVPTEQVDPAVLDLNQITDVTFNDENVGQVVGVPAVNLQAAIDAGLAASNVESFDVIDTPVHKAARGETTSFAHIDEAAFQNSTPRQMTHLNVGDMPAQEATEVVAEHMRGGKQGIAMLDEAAFYPIGTAELKEQPIV